MDAWPPEEHNWLQYCNHAPEREQEIEQEEEKDTPKSNVHAFQYEGRVLYRALRKILPGEELYVDYGPGRRCRRPPNQTSLTDRR